MFEKLAELSRGARISRASGEVRADECAPIDRPINARMALKFKVHGWSWEAEG
jgi:hypothetical protein